LEKSGFLVPVADLEGEPSPMILPRYNKSHSKAWWYDVKYNHWTIWEDRWWLALLLAKGNRLSFVMFDPKTTKDLLNRIAPKVYDTKQIHVKEDGHSGNIRLGIEHSRQEWQGQFRVFRLTPHDR